MTLRELAPVAKVSLLLKQPREKVFRYFVEPELLTQFWLAKASAPLALGSRARWDFMVPGASDEVVVKELNEPRGLTLQSSDGSEIAWGFEERPGRTTLVTIQQRGFPGAPEEAVDAALEAVGGFTLVLAELKLLLEQGRAMGLVSDKALLIREQLAEQPH